MLIECVHKQTEPVVVAIGNEKYTFEPDAEGRKVAEVWLEPHIEAFLAVPHLYRKLADEAEAETEAKPTTGEANAAPIERKAVIAALKERAIKFAVTETTDALRAKLAPAQP